MENESLRDSLIKELKNNLIDKYASNFINLTSNEAIKILNYICKLQGKETIEKQNINMVEDITQMRDVSTRMKCGSFRPLTFRKEIAGELLNQFLGANPDKDKEFRDLWEESCANGK